MNTLEQDATEFRLNSLAIAEQSLRDKDKQIQELRNRVEILENLLTRLSSQRVPLPQAQPQGPLTPAPRRWSVR